MFFFQRTGSLALSCTLRHTQVQIPGVGIKAGFLLKGRLQRRRAPWLHISSFCVRREMPADAQMLLSN